MKLDPVLPLLLQSATPLFLGGIGCVIGVTVLRTPGLSDAKWSAGFGLAGGAIAAAAGLARNGGSEHLPVENAKAIADLRMQQENLASRVSDSTPDPPAFGVQQSQTVTKQISFSGSSRNGYDDPP